MAKHETPNWKEKISGVSRAENPRPKNTAFVVPPFDGGWYGDTPEKIAQHTVEMTVATVDGVRVAYVSKDSPFNIALDRRSDPHYDGVRTLRDTWTYYAVGKDGKPDNRLMTSPWGEAQRGAWQVESLRAFHKSHSDVLPSKKIALELMAEMKAEWDAEDGGRRPNGVRIPAYLRTPKLKPYIEQGLITQEIVDLYEQAHELAKEYIEIERHQDQNLTPLTPEKHILLRKVCSVGSKLYDLLKIPPYYAEDFPFMRGAVNYGDKYGSAVGLEMIQKYRGIMRKSLRGL